MSYIITGQGVDSAVCHSLLVKQYDKVVRAEGVDAEVTLQVESAFLSFGSEAEKYKPVLLLMGRPVSLRGDFPCGIEEISYTSPADRAMLVYRYEFNRQNLKAMVGKGFYEPEFTVPDIIRQNTFQLPCKAVCVCLPGRDASEPPLGFASIMAGSCVCTDETSGYEISDYFEYVDELGKDRPYEPQDAPEHLGRAATVAAPSFQEDVEKLADRFRPEAEHADEPARDGDKRPAEPISARSGEIEAPERSDGGEEQEYL